VTLKQGCLPQQRIIFIRLCLTMPRRNYFHSAVKYIKSNLLWMGFYILPLRPMPLDKYYVEQTKKPTYSVDKRNLKRYQSRHKSQKDAERNLGVHFAAFR
jgi:hypothetical protein